MGQVTAVGNLSESVRAFSVAFSVVNPIAPSSALPAIQVAGNVAGVQIQQFAATTPPLAVGSTFSFTGGTTGWVSSSRARCRWLCPQ